MRFQLSGCMTCINPRCCRWSKEFMSNTTLVLVLIKLWHWPKKCMAAVHLDDLWWHDMRNVPIFALRFLVVGKLERYPLHVCGLGWQLI